MSKKIPISDDNTPVQHGEEYINYNARAHSNDQWASIVCLKQTKP